jgi:hypothetical protein
MLPTMRSERTKTKEERGHVVFRVQVDVTSSGAMGFRLIHGEFSNWSVALVGANMLLSALGEQFSHMPPTRRAIWAGRLRRFALRLIGRLPRPMPNGPLNTEDIRPEFRTVEGIMKKFQESHLVLRSKTAADSRVWQ